MSCGIWLLIDDWTPGFEGLEDLLPTKRLRGLAAPFEFDSPTLADILAWEYNVGEEHFMYILSALIRSHLQHVMF
jgi:hypothetical protein